MRAPHTHFSAAHHAIVKGLTSFIVGLVIFFGLALLRLPPLVGPFVRHVQVLGIDLGMYAESFLRLARSSTSDRFRYHYVLFDLDREACTTLYPRDGTCTPTAPADRRILATMVRVARDSAALVVIVDVAAAWPAPHGDDPLTAALIAPSHMDIPPPPVVLPLLADITPQPHGRDNRQVYAIRPLRRYSGPLNLAETSRVYFGLPFGSSGESGWGGDVVRSYARSLVADDLTASAGPHRYWTLAGAAACLAPHPTPSGACRVPSDNTTTERIHFSVPSMVLRSPTDPRNAATRWWATRLQASAELTGGETSFAAAPYLRNAIVIIGSSRDLRDYHDTPLGPMTGAEILLNAIRSFLEFPRPGDVGLLGSSVGEAVIIAITSSIFAAFWLIISGRRFRPSRNPLWHHSLRAFILRGAGFLLTCALAVCSAFVLGLVTVMLQSVSGYDIVAPVLVTALEGTVEGMHVIIGSVEAVIFAALASVVAFRSKRRGSQVGKQP